MNIEELAREYDLKVSEIEQVERRESLDVIEAGLGAGVKLDNIQETFIGSYDSEEEFARQLSEETEPGIRDLPFYCYINWELVAKDLMYDYVEQDGYYFRV